MPVVPVYPVRVEGRLDERLSRWLWLVKWLLAIPHYVVLFFLWAAFVVLSLIALVAIVATGRYPRSIFDFNLGVLRWTWRVAFYSFSALGTDRYPPFSLGEEPEYPARLSVAYPERLSRGLVLVKWWLLAIPHYAVVGIFAGGAVLAWQDEDWRFAGGGLIGLLVLFAGVALLFTGRYPNGIFDLVLGLNRWVLRVAAYAGLMTDAYPPFRLDTGPTERGDTVTLEQAAPAEPRTRGETAGGGWGAGRVLLAVVGSLAVMVSLLLVVGGGAALVIDRTQRDADGFVMSPTESFSTGAYAIVSETRTSTSTGRTGWSRTGWARCGCAPRARRRSSSASVARRTSRRISAASSGASSPTSPTTFCAPRRAARPRASRRTRRSGWHPRRARASRWSTGT